MLVNLTIENWMSFRDVATLSMVATKEQQHGERVRRMPKYRIRILPVAVLFGGNASGKTNLLKALSFIRRFVVEGTEPGSLIPVHPYRLSDSVKKPSKFSITILVGETMYELSFTVSTEQVLEEKLVRISSATERVLYHRTGPDGGAGGATIVFDGSLPEQELLKSAARETRDNQLFLTSAVSQKVTAFLPIYEWFRRSLRMISPDTRFGAYELFYERECPPPSTVHDLLAKLDTGIIRLERKGVPEKDVPLPKDQLNELQSKLRPGMVARVPSSGIRDRLLICKWGSSLVTTRLVAFRLDESGAECAFDLALESDGTLQLVDLVPAFADLTENRFGRVYVIDDLDRNLHSLTTRYLVEMYLAACSSSTCSQLIFATHDLMLMDQKLFRRDEMWITERDRLGVSTLVSFAKYGDGIRFDKDVQKSYLQGRLGGIPRIRRYSRVPESKGAVGAVREG